MRSQKRAHEGEGDELARLVFCHQQQGGQRGPVLDTLLAERHEGVIDRADFGGAPEKRRVHIEQEAVRERHIAADELLQLSEVRLDPLNFREQPQTREFRRRYLLRAHGRGTREEVALKVVVSGAEGPLELFLGLDLFGEHGDSQRLVDTQEALLVRSRSGKQVHLDELSQAGERFTPGIRHKIVQGEGISLFAEPPARSQDLGIRLRRFENLDHQNLGRENGM